MCVRRILGIAGTLGTLCALVSCAARGPAPALLAELGKADSLVAAGCYRCLQDALATYVRLSASPNGPPESRRRAFETALLIAVRAKELGLPADAPLQRAHELAAQLTPAPPRKG